LNKDVLWHRASELNKAADNIKKVTAQEVTLSYFDVSLLLYKLMCLLLD